MPTTIGSYSWESSRGNPSAGLVTLASDPLLGYANTLRVSQTDSEGNDRSSALADVDEGDAILLVTEGLIQTLLAGMPADSGDFYSFPVTIGYDFEEPADGGEAYLLRRVGVDWPTVSELAQVLNVAPSSAVTAWTTTLTRVLNSAIDIVKGKVGNWDDINDVPSDRHSQAALRMAELLSERPDATADELAQDRAFRLLMTGKRRRFGVS